MITAILLMSAAADPSALMKRAARRLSPSASWSLPQSGDPAPRIAADPTLQATMKDVALREDGTRCSLVGARVCTSSPRTLVTTDF